MIMYRKNQIYKIINDNMPRTPLANSTIPLNPWTNFLDPRLESDISSYLPPVKHYEVAYELRDKVYIVLLHCRLNRKLRYISRSWRSRRYRLRPRDSRKFGADVPGHGMSISSTLTSNYRRVEKSETPNTEKIILSINSHLVQLDTNSKRKINIVSIVAHCVE